MVTEIKKGYWYRDTLQEFQFRRATESLKCRSSRIALSYDASIRGKYYHTRTNTANWHTDNLEEYTEDQICDIIKEYGITISKADLKELTKSDNQLNEIMLW